MSDSKEHLKLEKCQKSQPPSLGKDIRNLIV